jgi:hypothetical protein
MGVLSYRTGKVYRWDSAQRKPVPDDGSWAAMWEKRSHERAKPNNIIGWQAGDTGCVVKTPDYNLKLGGPWINGRDPAERGS